MTDLPSRYNPKEVEDKWYKFWEEKGFFHAEANPKKKPYCIVIPPPNITGILHMGHALNNTIQDILIRHKRMQGYSSLWMPGTDHAGIATQNAVEKSIAKEGLKRQDLGREKFIERVWKWREQYGSTIIHQLKKLGSSCDWERTRFTMDENYSKAVVEVFIKLYEKGLIYRGSYIINWCPRCQTALSDEEAPYRELQGNLYYLKYPFSAEGGSASGGKDGDYIVVATTRPETMLGDTAVAVNPKDKRYKKLIGKILILPLMKREIKIIADSMVDMKFGTGAVKVTPAHDPNDYALGKKHNLEFVKVMHPDGRMNENAGEYQNMDRFEAREVILEDLKEGGFLEKVEPHKLSSGHCYRCHTIIEPYLSKQWFVKMKPLAKPAIEAVKKGKIKFHPKRWTKVYLNWMENIQDWCISRQIWWGHRIPVYYCKKCQETGILSKKLKAQSAKQEKGVIVSRIKPEKCPQCNSSDIYQDEDVLDTWFSSWLWPFATFGKNKEELKYFYPTSVLVTAQEIIFFWVARIVMAGCEFMGNIPFKDVYIHGTVRDDTGTKMSKSLGNIIDPLEIIEQYGADALRFSLISITAVGQDVFLSREKFELGRNFANKLWNAARFVLMNLSPDLKTDYKKEELSLADKWILSRLNHTIGTATKCLDDYKFNEAANTLYEFIWHEFCDWYLELSKGAANQAVLCEVLGKALKLLHPFMPFISEEIWQKLPHQDESIMVSPWPKAEKENFDAKAEEKMQLIITVITAIRNLRLEMNIPLGQKSNIIVSARNKHQADILNENISYLSNLAKIEKFEAGAGLKKPKSSATAIASDMEIFMPLEGLIDLQSEKKRLAEQVKAGNEELNRLAQQLKNKDFVTKAPKDIVDKIKEKHSVLKETIIRLENNLKSLN